MITPTGFGHGDQCGGEVVFGLAMQGFFQQFGYPLQHIVFHQCRARLEQVLARACDMPHQLLQIVFIRTEYQLHRLQAVLHRRIVIVHTLVIVDQSTDQGFRWHIGHCLLACQTAGQVAQHASKHRIGTQRFQFFLRLVQGDPQLFTLLHAISQLRPQTQNDNRGQHHNHACNNPSDHLSVLGTCQATNTTGFLREGRTN